ncbi:MAG: chemotaxis protein CheR [Salinisphaera sp.]|jgi:chemotaxis protein methyltransferase CheR|nr:chemotaxis protein CheR [Salinisphaera sp.]
MKPQFQSSLLAPAMPLGVQPAPGADLLFDPLFDLLFTDSDFNAVRQMIGARAGIALGPQKRKMAYSRLARRVRDTQHGNFADYIRMLQRSDHHPEWEYFVNALTTNLTAFFREAHHFPILARLLADRAQPPAIWCCAASTGEEAYSIAMTLSETLGPRATQARIKATDIDTRALGVARAGIYPLAEIEKLSDARRKTFFLKGSGAQQGLARVSNPLRAMVDFSPLNLLAPAWDVGGPFDAIFCRNLMIYFDKALQIQLLSRFAKLLKPDGLLFAGHSENFNQLGTAFRLRGQTVYELKPPARSVA